MARKTQSRMKMREQVEAAARQSGTPDAAAKKRTERQNGRQEAQPRAKSKAAERKRLMWAVYNGSMKEEGRFPYDRARRPKIASNSLSSSHQRRSISFRRSKKRLSPSQKRQKKPQPSERFRCRNPRRPNRGFFIVRVLSQWLVIA